MKRRYQLVLAMSALSVAGSVMADEPTQQAAANTASTFAALDVDKDGKISPSEATADTQIADKFVAADKNQDGYLDTSEYQSIAKS
jgi:Ca2+-binding EF-hand superfamily protein